MTRNFAVVMAGGGGTRFWPVSRQGRPKQLLPLVGDSTLLQQTVDRMLGLVGIDRVLIVTGASLESAVREQLPSLPAENVLVEPTGRNTAAAIGLAAVVAHERDPESVLSVVPSDHFIGDLEAFLRLGKSAAELAGQGHLTTLGIAPTRPETAYGYIRFGDFLAAPSGAAGEDDQPKARMIAAFTEKPNAEVAARYLREGRYLWNSGMFFVRADAALRYFSELLPELSAGLDQIAQAYGSPTWGDTLNRVYPTLQAVSFDYGVMEHVKDAVVVPASMAWSDVGSWSVLDDLRPEGAETSEFGDVIALDSSDNVLYADAGCVVATIGVSGLVVATSGGRVLVCPKERAQDVRRVVDELAKRGWTHFS